MAIGPARVDTRGCGWSLLELIVALATLAIVLGSAAPVASGVLGLVRLRGAAVEFGSALLRARGAALAEGRSWEVKRTAASSFSVGPVGGTAAPETLSGGATFASATSGGAVRFSSSGIGENATFTLTLGGRETRVVVNQRGRVTLE